MTKERTIELLEDIKPSKMRLRQLEYLILAPEETDNLKAVSYGEKVATYTTGDTTADAAITKLDKRSDQLRELEVVRAKLDLYNEWMKALKEEQRQLVTELYIDCHSIEWLAMEKGYEGSTLRNRKARVISRLSEIQVSVVTEIEKERARRERN